MPTGCNVQCLDYADMMKDRPLTCVIYSAFESIYYVFSTQCRNQDFVILFKIQYK